MSDEGQRQYFNPIPPVQSTTPGVGVTWLGTSTTARSYDLGVYPDMFGKLVEFIASGGKIWVSFSTDGQTAISKTGTKGTDGVSTAIADGTAAANPIPIGDGGVLLLRLNKSTRWLHVQADSGTPTLIVRPAAPARESAPRGS